MSDVAVALFVFNRPRSARAVLSRIRLAQPSSVLIIADGPRETHPGDMEACDQTRAIVDEIDWDCDVRTCFSDTNLGCRLRISSGLDWVFEQVDRAIILEDDCLPHPDFFPFCTELLERHADDPRVHMIGGSNLLFGQRYTPHSYYYSRFYHIWGWATWARAWRHFDLEMRHWPALRDSDWLKRWLPHEGMVDRAREIFESTYSEDRYTTWDYQWVFSGWLQQALAVVPAVNLVSNVGYGGDATHTRDASSRLAHLETGALDWPLDHPDTVEVLEQADRHEWAALNPGVKGRSTLRSRLHHMLGRIRSGKAR